MAEKKHPDQVPAGKVGVYVCHCGGNISDEVDVEKVCEQARKVPGVVVARANMFMCSDPGQELIIEDLKSGLVDRVVVASCSPSLHESTFRQALARAGVNPYVYEHANLREQVSWVHHGDEATAKATRLVAAAAAKAGMLEALEPIRVEVNRQAVVIGGGVAGLKTALELAERGLPVVLVEKGPFLGDRWRNWIAWRPGEKRPPGSSANSPGPCLSIRPLPCTAALRWKALRAISAISSLKSSSSLRKAAPMPRGWRG